MTPFRRRSNRLQPVKTQSTFHCSRNTAPVDFCGSSFKKPNPDSGTQTASFQQVRIQSPPPHLRLVQRLLPTLQSQPRPLGSAAYRKRSAEEKVAPVNAPTSLCLTTAACSAPSPLAAACRSSPKQKHSQTPPRLPGLLS